MIRHTLFGVNPIAIYDLPPPLPPNIPQHLAQAQDEVASSVVSSRANSVQPSDMDEPKRLTFDRFGRQVRERTNSPDPRTRRLLVNVNFHLQYWRFLLLYPLRIYLMELHFMLMNW